MIKEAIIKLAQKQDLTFSEAQTVMETYKCLPI